MILFVMGCKGRPFLAALFLHSAAKKTYFFHVFCVMFMYITIRYRYIITVSIICLFLITVISWIASLRSQ